MGDLQRWTLEDRLPQLMRELETPAVEAEERRLAKEREGAERERRWEIAMAHAKTRLIEDHRREVLRSRVTAWNEATRSVPTAMPWRIATGSTRSRPIVGLSSGSHSPASKPTTPNDSRECWPIRR
jgi:hypothetical protein